MSHHLIATMLVAVSVVVVSWVVLAMRNNKHPNTHDLLMLAISVSTAFVGGYNLVFAILCADSIPAEFQCWGGLAGLVAMCYWGSLAFLQFKRLFPKSDKVD
jgi:heme/copper-type cytochrome/quinol oxidase subunit 3